MYPSAHDKLTRLLQQIAVCEAIDSGTVSAICPSVARLALYSQARDLREDMARHPVEVVAPATPYAPGVAS